jgi:hypothetical protein
LSTSDNSGTPSPPRNVEEIIAIISETTPRIGRLDTTAQFRGSPQTYLHPNDQHIWDAPAKRLHATRENVQNDPLGALFRAAAKFSVDYLCLQNTIHGQKRLTYDPGHHL